MDQVKNLDGENTIHMAENLGIGTTKYNLISIDEDGGEESENESEGSEGGEEGEREEGEREEGEKEEEKEEGEKEDESETSDEPEPDTSSGNPGSFIGWNHNLILLFLLLFVK